MIAETSMRFRTKKQAQKEARIFNKGSSVKHVKLDGEENTGTHRARTFYILSRIKFLIFLG
jgi:hypothetical protein